MTSWYCQVFLLHIVWFYLLINTLPQVCSYDTQYDVSAICVCHMSIQCFPVCSLFSLIRSWFQFSQGLAAFHGDVWYTVNCDAVKLVLSHSIPAASIHTLLNGGNYPFSPSLFIIGFHQFMHVIGSAACDLGTLLCWTGAVCMNVSANFPVPFFICSHKYCSVFIGVLHILSYM